MNGFWINLSLQESIIHKSKSTNFGKMVFIQSKFIARSFLDKNSTIYMKTLWKLVLFGRLGNIVIVQQLIIGAKEKDF